MFPVSDRFRRAVRGSATTPVRVEVWAAGEYQGDATESITEGDVVDERATGIRRSITATVAVDRRWRRWFQLPALELHPYGGVELRRGEVEWCPLGRFRLSPVAPSADAATVTVRGADRWSLLSARSFLRPVPSYAGRVSDVAARLIDEADVGLGQPTVNRSTWNTTLLTPTVWTGPRHKVVADLLTSITAEAFVDREGRPVIQDRVNRGLPTWTADPATLLTHPASSVDWDRVRNVVSVASNNRDAAFPPQIAAVTWQGHPAHPSKIGIRDELITIDAHTWEHALAVANVELERRSLAAQSYTFEQLWDPSLDAGDFGTVDTGDGAPFTAQAQSVTHPLTGGAQRVTTVSTADSLDVAA